MRRNGEITTEHILGKEGPEHMKRRERKKLLKTEFRIAAERAALKVFGTKSPVVDIIREKENCTAGIVKGIIKQAKDDEAKFDEVFLRFMENVELEKGRMEFPGGIWYEISRIESRKKEKLAIASIEILLSTENEMRVLNLLAQANNGNREAAVKMAEGIIKFSGIDYIHTIGAFIEAFAIDAPYSAERMALMSGKVEVRPSQHGSGSENFLASDYVLSGIVRGEFGL